MQTDTTATDQPAPDAFAIAADAVDIHRPEETTMIGTRHILDADDRPLCGNHVVAGHVANGKYAIEHTRYPLNSYELCGNCAKSYLATHGSNDDVFAAIPTYSKGDWLKITTTDGDTITGRVYNASDASTHPTRYVRLVVSDEPQQRWVYGIDDEIKIQVKEGHQPSVDGTLLIEDLERMDPPADNIDARTAATIDELEDIVGVAADTVMPVGSDPFSFHLNVRPDADVWALADRLYDHGYAITSTVRGDDRPGTNTHAIGLTASELADP